MRSLARSLAPPRRPSRAWLGRRVALRAPPGQLTRLPLAAPGERLCSGAVEGLRRADCARLIRAITRAALRRPPACLCLCSIPPPNSLAASARSSSASRAQKLCASRLTVAGRATAPPASSKRPPQLIADRAAARRAPVCALRAPARADLLWARAPERRRRRKKGAHTQPRWLGRRALAQLN